MDACCVCFRSQNKDSTQNIQNILQSIHVKNIKSNLLKQPVITHGMQDTSRALPHVH